MLDRATSDNHSPLTSALEDLHLIGTALVRNFHLHAFPLSSRLARNLRDTLDGAAPDLTILETTARADAMILQAAQLQEQLNALPGLGELHTHRITRIIDTLASYRAALKQHAAA